LNNKFRQEIYSDTRKILKTIGIHQEQSSSSSTTNSNISNKTSKRKKNDLVMETDVMQEFAGDVDDESDSDSDEIDRYINTKLPFSKDDTLLGWWNKHSLIFPQLSLLAKSLFGVPASSATSERIFSSSGQILEKRRQSLNPEIVDDILMIRNFRDM
jgi:hAT family C-terminal dimerisation region